MTTQWLNTLPENPGPARSQAIVDAAKSGMLQFDWTDLDSKIDGHEATISVLADAAYVVLDDGSRYRPEAGAHTLQLIADAVGGCLCTSKILDLRHQQAPQQFDATTLPASPNMSLTSYSKIWNIKVEAKRGNLTYMSDVGKPFILDNALYGSAGAVLYGFFSTTAPYTNPHSGLKLWQNIGTHHDGNYSDESSTIILIKNTCELDGRCINITDLFTDPVLSYLINYDGLLKYSRQPGV